MMRSDIFNSYAKIAEDMGLVSNAKDDEVYDGSAPKESAKLKKYKKSPHPRMGSDDISVIEALYGVKPDTIPYYEFNIMEAAHPKPVVIGPAYDRINALVENNNERQNIIINQVMRPNNSISDNVKLAKNELVMELVRLANDLDLANKAELCKLADNALVGLAEKKKFNVVAGIGDWLQDKGDDVFQAVKGYGTGALVGGVIGGLVGAIGGEGVGAIPGAMFGARLGGIAGGLIASIARTSPRVVNVATNAKDVSEQINDIKNKLPQGTEYKFLDDFQKELGRLSDASEKYNEIVSNIQQAHDNSTNEDANSAHTITSALMESMKNVADYTVLFNDRVKRSVYQEYVGHSKALTPVYELISDDIEDVQSSLQSLTAAMNNLRSSMKNIPAKAKSVVENVKASQPSSNNRSHEEPVGGAGSEDEEFVGENGEENEPQNTGTKNDEGGFLDSLMSGLGRKPSKQEEEWFRSLK
jgi:hypothetical protein